MADYSGLTDEQLKIAADADEVGALFETARRAAENKDLRTARKFYTFAAQLGHAAANTALGRFYDEEGIMDKALELYIRGYELGDEQNIVRLAQLLMSYNEEYAVEFLTGSALSGNESSMEALENYYRGAGNAKEADFWKGKRDERKK